jgi:hypothetical protein
MSNIRSEMRKREFLTLEVPMVNGSEKKNIEMQL